VAKNVTLVGVRVLDCAGSGTWSGVIAGIDWVTGNHAAGAPAVANMSLGGGASTSVDTAVNNSIADGVTYAVAAGNGDSAGRAQDACGRSPARVPAALTVGATDRSDTKASWSNYGTCLDLFAPGVGITSTTMDGLTATWSGTSMATPHVAGVAALYLETAPAAPPAEVTSAITGQATPDVVLSPGTGSPNRLLFSLLTVAAPPPPANAAPTVTITTPANNSTVSGSSVAVSATATDTDGTISKVDFYLDSATTPFATDSDVTDGWTTTWDSTSVADGSHTIKAMATDSDGATASHSVSVTVDNLTDPALVTSVSAGASVKKGSWYNVKLTVTVSDGTTFVSGASVTLDVLSAACPGSSRVGGGTGTTDANGTYAFTFKSRTKAAHCAVAAATKNGYTEGQVSATFSS
jgi:hypothetical protein